MSLQWKMHTNFPFNRVFVLGVILFFLGLASMIIAIIAFVTQSWGHYVGTGMWGGATVLLTGISAVFVSRLRTLASVKTFCVCSLVAMFTSLTMLILSAGGLTLNSGFYNRIDLANYNKRTSNLIHASLLVISVFCLSGSVLAVIVCCKYLFFEHYDKPKHRRRHRNMTNSLGRGSSTLRGGSSNSSSHRSTSSRVPLHTSEQVSRRYSDIVDVNRVQIEYRRSHKRSASDQPHGNSQPRRQKHGHMNIGHGPSVSNNNVIFLNSVRSYPDRRSSSNRSATQGAEARGNSTETDGRNIAPPRQGTNRPLSQIHMQPRSPVSNSQKIRLPTEFNEEELPPYEAVESSANARNGSHSDSGDESDTENSSSTDAHSYIPAGEDGIEIVPMVQILHSRESNFSENNSREHKTTNFVSYDNIRTLSDEYTRERQSCAVLSPSDHTELVINEASCGEAAAVNLRKEQNKSNRAMLNYTNSHPSEQRDCEHLLSVSPEVCAITGESPELCKENEEDLPHVVHENFYENGPCYENVRCGGKNIVKTNMNHLSKSSSMNMADKTHTITSTRRKQTNSKSSSTKKVPVHIISHSSEVSSTFPQSPLSPFGSTLSAFRPVGAAFSSSPHICSSTADVHPLRSNINACSPQNDVADSCCGTQSLSSQMYINAHTKEGNGDSTSSHTVKYVEQGAIPKAVKQRDEATNSNSNSNMSWKNIPLPLSYNHSESASNDSEKKLPSKTIPLADSDPDLSRSLLKKEESNRTSPSSRLPACVCPPQNVVMSSSKQLCSSPVSNPTPPASTASPFGAASEALLAVSTKRNSNSISEAADTHSKQVHEPAVTALSTTTVSSVREASTQVNSGSTSHWHSHRMGGNQSLLQNRRDELHNSHLSNRSTEASNRATRPTSMLLSGSLGGVSHGISPQSVDRHPRNRTSEASSYFASRPLQNQQAQSLALRQNHLLQHYPLQPQQPRLGVQLHQRRQQQNQLQQNIESQQQQQQIQQQQQLLPQPQEGNQQNLQNQQGRIDRPLFSVLL